MGWDWNLGGGRDFGWDRHIWNLESFAFKIPLAYPPPFPVGVWCPRGVRHVL